MDISPDTHTNYKYQPHFWDLHSDEVHPRAGQLLSPEEDRRLRVTLNVYQDVWTWDGFVGITEVHPAVVSPIKEKISDVTDALRLSEMSENVNADNNIVRQSPESPPPEPPQSPEYIDLPILSTAVISSWGCEKRQTVRREQVRERINLWLDTHEMSGSTTPPPSEDSFVEDLKISLTHQEKLLKRRIAYRAARLNPGHKVNVQPSDLRSPRLARGPQTPIRKRGRPRKSENRKN